MSLLSIFSFDTLQLGKARPKGFFRALALTLALVFVAEIGARILVQRASPYYKYWEDEPGFRFEAYRQQILQGETPEVVIIGDSTARYGIDSPTLRANLSAAIDMYNLSSPANFPMACHCTTLPLLQEPYKPPKLVIAMFSPNGFVATAAYETLILNSPICRKVTSPFSYHRELRLLWLMRMSPYLKNPEVVDKKLRQVWEERGFTPLTEATAQQPITHPGPAKPSASAAEIEAEKLQVIRDLALLARNRNFKLVLVVPPLMNRDRMVEELVGRIGQLQDESGFLLLDFSASAFLSARHFFDNTHLNKDGAEIFSEQLGRTLSTRMPEIAQFTDQKIVGAGK